MQGGHATLPTVELFLELPAKLGDVRTHLDRSLPQFLDDTVTEGCDTEAWTREADGLETRRRNRHIG